MNEETNLSNKTPNILLIKSYLFARYDFRLNVITQTLEYKKKQDQNFVPLTSKAKTDIIIELKTANCKKPNEDLDDLLNSSLIPEFDAIKQYFDNLQYIGDGYIELLANCIKLKEPEKIVGGYKYKDLFNHYFKKWLLACYLCSTKQTVNDVMFILIGAQGRFKTSFLNNLVPANLIDYRVCSNIIPSLNDYSTANFLAEKFLINVDDQMENIFGKDYNSMKAIISAPDVTTRKLYKSYHERRARIANFCASVNEPRFLRDSNNRRYLCFEIEDIFTTYSQIDINGLWAEVKHEAERTTKKYIFGKDDYLMIDLLNMQFEAPTEEAETLQTYFKPATEEDKTDIYYLSFTEIMQILRDKTHSQHLKTYNLQTAMRKYGYQPQTFRKQRFANQPRHLYPIQILNGDSDLISLLYNFK